MTKDVRDAAIMLQAMAGHDPKDSTSADLPLPVGSTEPAMAEFEILQQLDLLQEMDLLKELDLLLLNYLEQSYPAAPAADQQAFESILLMPDPELNDLILGRSESGDEDIARVISIDAGDVLLADCLMCNWRVLFSFKDRGVVVVTRLNKAHRKADFRRGKRLGPGADVRGILPNL